MWWDWSTSQTFVLRCGQELYQSTTCMIREFFPKSLWYGCSRHWTNLFYSRPKAHWHSDSGISCVGSRWQVKKRRLTGTLQRALRYDARDWTTPTINGAFENVSLFRPHIPTDFVIVTQHLSRLGYMDHMDDMYRIRSEKFLICAAVDGNWQHALHLCHVYTFQVLLIRSEIRQNCCRPKIMESKRCKNVRECYRSVSRPSCILGCCRLPE
jgi:hypothetical protein